MVELSSLVLAVYHFCIMKIISQLSLNSVLNCKDIVMCKNKTCFEFCVCIAEASTYNYSGVLKLYSNCIRLMLF